MAKDPEPRSCLEEKKKRDARWRLNGLDVPVAKAETPNCPQPKENIEVENSATAQDFERCVIQSRDRYDRVIEALRRNPNFEYQGIAIEDLSDRELNELLTRIEQHEGTSAGLESRREKSSAKHKTVLPAGPDNDQHGILPDKAKKQTNTVLPQAKTEIAEELTGDLLRSGVLPKTNGTSHHTEISNFHFGTDVRYKNDSHFRPAKMPHPPLWKATKNLSPFEELIGRILLALGRFLGIIPRKPHPASRRVRQQILALQMAQDEKDSRKRKFSLRKQFGKRRKFSKKKSRSVF